MTELGLTPFLILAAFLFCCGVFCLATKRHAVGLLMGVGQFLGAQTGSRFAMRQGARIIKPLLVVTCVALAIRLLADPTNPIRVWIGV